MSPAAHGTKLTSTIFFICTITLLSLLISSVGKTESYHPPQGTLVVTGDPWPPFADPNDPNLGIAPCILSKTLTNPESKVKMLFQPWARAEIAVDEGRADVLINCAKTDRREETYYFSNPYIKIKLVLIKRSDDPFVYTGPNSLSGKRIGTVYGYAYPDYFINDEKIYKDPVKTISDNFKKLHANRIDLIIDDELVATKQLLSMSTPYSNNFEIIPTGIAPINLHIATSRKNTSGPQIIELFNTNLKKIMDNGVYQDIMSAYQANNSSIQ